MTLATILLACAVGGLLSVALAVLVQSVIMAAGGGAVFLGHTLSHAH